MSGAYGLVPPQRRRDFQSLALLPELPRLILILAGRVGFEPTHRDINSILPYQLGYFPIVWTGFSPDWKLQSLLRIGILCEIRTQPAVRERHLTSTRSRIGH